MLHSPLGLCRLCLGWRCWRAGLWLGCIPRSMETTASATRLWRAPLRILILASMTGAARRATRSSCCCWACATTGSAGASTFSALIFFQLCRRYIRARWLVAAGAGIYALSINFIFYESIIQAESLSVCTEKIVRNKQAGVPPVPASQNGRLRAALD